MSVKCFVDNGSTCNIMPFDILQNIVKNPLLQNAQNQLKFYDRTTMKPIGKYSLYTKIKDKFFKLQFEIVSTKVSRNPLLSANTREQLSLISINNEVNAIGNSTSVETLVEKYADVFEGLGCLPGKLHLEIDKNVTPVDHSPRKIPVALTDDINSKLEQMIKQGILKEVNEPANWISCFVAVKKPKKLKICIYPEDLNKPLKHNHYYIKTLGDILHNLAKVKVFFSFKCKRRLSSNRIR